MKPLGLFLPFLVLSISLFSSTANAQTQLWGMTSGGGQYDAGVIFNTDSSGNYQIVQNSFLPGDGNNPLFTNLIQANDGMLYGLTYKGGTSDSGALFQYDPATSVYSKKFDFDGPLNGSKPLGSLMQASNGLLYGMAYKGGTHDKGVLFQYDPATYTFTKKLDFDGTTTGCYPHGSLMQASDGMLYGMTVQGGVNDKGVLFQFDPISSTFSKKIDLDSINGSNPLGALMQAKDGKLYGLTCTGGVNDMGVLFQYDANASTYTKKVDFTGITNGNNPIGFLIQANDGKMYGMTNRGGTNDMGVLFQFDPVTSQCNKKLDFDSINGSYPYGSLLQASDGNIYGMTELGGIYGLGILFQYDPTSSTFAKKFDFDGTNGSLPYGSLIEINASNSGVIDYSDPATQLSIYPNPNRGEFTIRSTKEGSYSLVNIFGQTVRSINLNSANDYRINIKGLRNGIYSIIGFSKDRITRQNIVITK